MPVVPMVGASIDQLWETYEFLMPFVLGGVKGIAILLLGWIVSKWTRRLIHASATKARLDPALSGFFGQIGRYVVLAATVITALGAVGVQTTSLLTLFASAGLAVGLALQGSLSNFASGVMLLFFRPFDLGDMVVAAGEMGTVLDIGLFATTLVTLDNDTIIVPNGSIMGNNITNYTRRGTRRACVGIGVAYGTPVRVAMEALDRAARRAELVLGDPAPVVALVGFGASSVDFEVRVWSRADDWIPMQHHVRVAIYEELDAAGVEIPFEQLVLHRSWEESA